MVISPSISANMSAPSSDDSSFQTPRLRYSEDPDRAPEKIQFTTEHTETQRAQRAQRKFNTFWFVLCVSVCSVVFFCPLAHAGSLTTLEGKSFDGTITFDSDNALLISPKNAPRQRVDIANLLHATFTDQPPALTRGVLLTSGEAIAADAITRLDDDGARIVRPGGVAVTIAQTDLAAVFFRPVTPDMLKRIPPGHTGAILDNGDFFDGDPAGFDGNRLKISSVLFGIQTFDVTRQARAVILQDATTPDADKIIRLMDGSILLAKTISIADNRLAIDDARLGSVTVSSQNLVDITTGGNAFDALTQLTPSNVDGPPAAFATDNNTTGAPLTLLGIKAAHGIGQRPGVSLTWDVAGKYKSMIAEAGVPLGLVPMQRIQFVVLTDGKEVFRSPPKSSIDYPTAIGVNLTDVKTLTFRVEGADPLAPGAAGLWADPILVRGK
jgi:hypothetical protein